MSQANAAAGSSSQLKQNPDSGPPAGPTADAPPGPACYRDDNGATGTNATTAAEIELALPATAPPACEPEWGLLANAMGLGRHGKEQAMFPPLKWASVEKANTLMKAKALPAVKALTQIFSEAGFAPSVNFNVGSGELSITIPRFPKDDELQTPRPAVVRAMLAALPEQAALEEFYTTQKAAVEAVNAAGDLLANRCLDMFARQTGVGIWQRTVDTRMKTVKLSFAAYDDLFGGPRKMLKYAPCYAALTGFRDTESYQALKEGSSEDLKLAMDTARDQLISDMMACFWKNVADFPYVATPSLRTTLGDELRAYITAGLSDPAGGFLPPPEKHFSFFLYGGAGTGKSTMVAAFAKALQASLRRFVDAGRRADIVKVPLNGLTPESLGMILRVQGISDMSIERLLEQTVQHGSVAILHLEEVPEDRVLQEALVSTVKSMLEALLRRYHLYAGNVILAYTSNYHAAPAVASCTTEITVVTPSAQEQWQHCVGMLETSVKNATKASHVAVTLKYVLPLMNDMRPLCQWWTTLSYHISQRVEDYVSAHGSDFPPTSVEAVLSSANGGGMIAIDLKVKLDEDETKESRTSSGTSCSQCVARGQAAQTRECSDDKEEVQAAEAEEGLEGDEGWCWGVLSRGPRRRWAGEKVKSGGDDSQSDPEMQRIWGGWGALSRKTERRRGVGEGVRAWLDAFLIDNDTEGPFNKTLPSTVSPANVEESTQERCADSNCAACAAVGNIWTYIDCKGNYREPYIPPCSEPAVGADGEEHVQSQDLPLLHSRNNSFDASGFSSSLDEDESVDCAASNPLLLTVSSMDGFFFVEGDGADWGVAGNEAERFKRRKNATVVNMCLTSNLKPGVVVLTGSDERRAAVESEILEQVVIAAGSEHTQVVRVDLREEGDKDKVNGHQSQIRGGLFKVIDDFNNPNNLAASSQGVLVIVCNVNETGQYMLRELLETNGESRTHRYAIRKDRVLFVLSVDASAEMQEMTISRAHALINC